MTIKRIMKVHEEFPSVRVRWEDTAGHGGWTNKESYDTIMVDTHGYLIDHTSSKAVVASSMTDNGTFSDVSSIPTGCIREIVRTEDGKKVKLKR